MDVASDVLANVAKHAHATRARLELATAGRELILRVADDGVGGVDPRDTESRVRKPSAWYSARAACVARYFCAPSPLQ